MADAKKAKLFSGVFYPDSESYDCEKALASLSGAFTSWAYILHDKDTDEKGELKKAHYHWVGKCDPYSLSCIAQKLGVPENSVEYCKSWKSSVRYLIHKNNSNKFQYPETDIFANYDFSNDLANVDENGKSKQIFDYILSTSCNSVIELSGWCSDNGLWSEFRRSFSIWTSIMRELTLER